MNVFVSMILYEIFVGIFEGNNSETIVELKLYYNKLSQRIPWHLKRD